MDPESESSSGYVVQLDKNSLSPFHCRGEREKNQWNQSRIKKDPEELGARPDPVSKWTEQFITLSL